MPRANWGVESSDVDSFDRDSQYAPYTGPVPPSAVYQWKVKVLKHMAGTREKLPQLRVGLELVPRAEYDERKFKGYFAMAFLPIGEKTGFRYVPFLDALGVSGADFTRKTITDEEGNIKRIGQWRNDGDTVILAELKDEVDQNDNPRKGIGWIGPVTEADEYADDEESLDDYDADEYEDEDPDVEDEVPHTPPRRATKVAASKRRQAGATSRTSRRRTSRSDDDWS